eukprot:SAG31_NODE_1417_length_8440_cov_7.706510_4_plen_248_part_00
MRRADRAARPAAGRCDARPAAGATGGSRRAAMQTQNDSKASERIAKLSEAVGRTGNGAETMPGTPAGSVAVRKADDHCWRCACGEFTAELVGPPVFNFNCHCHSCVAPARFLDSKFPASRSALVDGKGVGKAFWLLENIKVRGYFLVFVQLFEKYGTSIERYTALIERVSALIVARWWAVFREGRRRRTEHPSIRIVLRHPFQHGGRQAVPGPCSPSCSQRCHDQCGPSICHAVRVDVWGLLDQICF